MAQKIIKPPQPILLQPLFNFPLRTKYILLAAIGLLFYGNSILNRYAFDDIMAIERNAFVQMGFQGIPKILTNDSWASYYTYWNADLSRQQSTGGRFRPLSQITFAIEQQFFGDSAILPYFRHLVNVLTYMACILAIFHFLRKFLLKKTPHGSDIAFLATFLFAIHPIHTEVVANIKSFDEILSLLFIMLTFIFSLTYIESKRIKHLVAGGCSFLLALLSKEYAVTLLFFIPFLFYLLKGLKPIPSLISSIPYYAVFVVYLLLRYNAVGFHSNIQSSNLLLNPYLYATHFQKIATEWFVLGKYVGLLFFPYPLTYDYSYNQITYHNLTDITVLLSILIYVGLLAWGIRLAWKKNILSFAAFFFLFNIFMISNLVLSIDGTMGERLVFHSSLGLLIIISYYVVKISSNAFGMTTKAKRNLLLGTMSVLSVVCFGETVIRNTQWKDYSSLFTHDTMTAPNSFMVNMNAGDAYLKLSEKKENTVEQTKAYLDSSRKYSLRALHFFPKLDNAYLNLGDVYYFQGLLDSAEYCWNMVLKITPSYPDVKPNFEILGHAYFEKATALGKSGKVQESISYMKKALSLDSTNSPVWYNIGGAYYTIKQYDSAKYAWVKALQYDSVNIDAKRGLQALSNIKQQ